MTKLIDYINFKIEQHLKHSKVNVVECLGYVKEEVLAIADKSDSLQRERDSLIIEVSTLRQKTQDLEKLVADHAGAQMQANNLEAELVTLRNENELLRGSQVGIGPAANIKNRWN